MSTARRTPAALPLDMCAPDSAGAYRPTRAWPLSENGCVVTGKVGPGREGAPARADTRSGVAPGEGTLSHMVPVRAAGTCLAVLLATKNRKRAALGSRPGLAAGRAKVGSLASRSTCARNCARLADNRHSALPESTSEPWQPAGGP